MIVRTDDAAVKEAVSAGCVRLTIRGIVQGVGFRPFIYNLARELALTGYVANTAGGVLIVAEGENLGSFIDRIRSEAPPLSRIERIDAVSEERRSYPDFTIAPSSGEGSHAMLSPDIATCDDCLAELFNPRDRRYRYPFTNCTNCGPRYSITERVPYDRANTTMRRFVMCAACDAEYHDPANRRFHAQPNACPVCGPRIRLLDASGSTVMSDDQIRDVRKLLADGKIIAVKGLGGFHLACDATNEAAVLRLRERKRKSSKPFAVMAVDREAVRSCCSLTESEYAVLRSAKRPIVLLEKAEPFPLPSAVAPGNRHLGVMLPYTPLHHLLFEADDSPKLLVMTSGNLSEEPIVADNDAAVRKLGGIADAFLVHDRDIFMRSDDSVLRVLPCSISRRMEEAKQVFYRRARGYVPEPIPFPGDGPDLLACGADLKNTFALVRGAHLILSQHIGDMENLETIVFFEEVLRNLEQVYRADPAVVVHDLHPDYFSTRWTRDSAVARKIGVQHHHAHIASVMAEHSLTDRVIGVALDGTGFGEDATIWGGEFIYADRARYERAGRFRPVPLPGGEQAVREPWRTAVSLILQAAGPDASDILEKIGFRSRYGVGPLDKIIAIAEKKEFSPLSSGAGRLFEAVAAMLGICDRNTFEGEAAMALETVADRQQTGVYPFDIRDSDLVEIDFSPAILAIAGACAAGDATGDIAGRFHNTVALAIRRAVVLLSDRSALNNVALSGGVFQNLLLLRHTIRLLEEDGFEVFMNELVPCNDAGIAVGQAWIARKIVGEGESR